MQNRYLLQVTFYAGSNDPGDTDEGTYLLTTSETLTYDQTKDLFYETSCKLSVYDENKQPELGISYEDGVNIDTLMNGILRSIQKTDKNASLKTINSDCGAIVADNFYEITQWH